MFCLMKKMIKPFAVLSAIIALLSCAKEGSDKETSESVNNVKVVQFTAGPLTKTVFGTPSGSSVPTLWTNKYCVALSLNYATPKKSSTPVVSVDQLTASFNASIEDDSSFNYNFFALSPYDAVLGFNSTNKNVSFEIPAAQSPSSTTPDEKAQILFGQSNEGASFPSSVTMTFGHLTAYGKISFDNLGLTGGETITSVALTAAVNWVGRYYYYIENKSPYSAGDFVENSASKTITINTDSSSDIWFACAPVDLGGKTVDVVINTDLGNTYSKTITIPAGKQFTSGVINAFTIDMDGIIPDGAVTYTKVTDVADLTLGSEIIIVATDDDYAISTTQNANNRAQASVTKSTNGSGDDIINNPGADVQIITIQNGNVAGTYALKVGEQYLYAVSSSNFLKTQASLDNTASWGITITASGVATIRSIGTDDTRILRYNSTNDLFACYSSGQDDVSIYKKDGTGSGAITAKTVTGITATGMTTSFFLGASFAFDGTVKLTYSDLSEEVIATGYTVTAVGYDKNTPGNYTVNITYDADPGNIHTSYTATVLSSSTYVWNLAANNMKDGTAYATSVSMGTPALTWSIAYTWKTTAPDCQSFNNTKGQQIGTGSLPPRTVVLTNSSYSSVSVTKVRVNACQGSSGSGSVTVSVGGTPYTCADNTLTTTATDFVFTGSSSGTIVITINETKDKALYLKSIGINED